jgi:hypothetical protein
MDKEDIFRFEISMDQTQVVKDCGGCELVESE